MNTCEILLIDDNSADAGLTREAFRDAGVDCDLIVKSDGVAALAYLRQATTDGNRPDLVLLDLNLPKMSGHEILRAIKSEPSLKSIPVLMLTTSGAEADIRRAYELGANGFVKKPTDLDHFVEMARAIDGFWFKTALLPPR